MTDHELDAAIAWELYRHLQRPEYHPTRNLNQAIEAAVYAADALGAKSDWRIRLHPDRVAFEWGGERIFEALEPNRTHARALSECVLMAVRQGVGNE
jgi:hypothetical protein